MSHADRLKWNARHAERAIADAAGESLVPEPFLAEALAMLTAHGLPRGQRALDVAAGRGRHALALARAGYDVLALDVSDVAMSELQARALKEGLRLEARAVDLDDGLPIGRWDLVVAFHFLDRRAFPALRAAVAPGGALIFETFTTAPADHASFNPAFCLEAGELAREVGDLSILLSRESDVGGRTVASLLAIHPLRTRVD